MIARHWHWRFTGFNHISTPEELQVTEGKVHWPMDVDVIGYLSEADARMAARDIVQRDHFVLKSVWECASCGYQQSHADTLTELVKAVKE